MRVTPIIVGFALGILQGCTGIYYVSGTAGTADDGIYLLRPAVSSTPVGPVYATGRGPHVAADGGIYYVSAVGGIEQIHRNGVQVTVSAGNKRNPAHASGWLAYEVADATSPTGWRIGLKQMPGGAESVLAYAVDGGLDFFDGAQKIAFLRPDGLYWASVNPPGPETPIAQCPQQVASGCSGPVVSHDGQRLAYTWYITFAGSIQSMVRILEIGTWSEISTIANNVFCPTCAPNTAGYVGRLGTVDFSPNDQWLYVAGSTRSEPGVTPGSISELYRVKIDGTAPARLTSNTVADVHPSTKLCTWFGC